MPNLALPTTSKGPAAALKRPAAALKRPAASGTSGYTLMWYKKGSKAAIRRSSGGKSQICQFGNAAKTQEQLMAIAAELVAKLNSGEMAEDQVASAAQEAIAA